MGSLSRVLQSECKQSIHKLQNHPSVLIKAQVWKPKSLRQPSEKLSDVQWIMSKHQGSFVFNIHPI